MFSIDLDCAQADKDILSADLFEVGCTGIVEVSETEERVQFRAFFDDDAQHRLFGSVAVDQRLQGQRALIPSGRGDHSFTNSHS